MSCSVSESEIKHEEKVESKELDRGVHIRESSTSFSCWKCQGSGKRYNKKEKEWVRGCAVCDGKGILHKRKRHAEGERQIGTITKQTRPPGWIVLGTEPIGDRGNPELHPQTGEQLCALSGNWRIFQKIGGHRYTTDEVVTAWLAITECESRRIHLGPEFPERHVDLGCGLGTVLMMVAWKWSHVIGRGIEAQQENVDMARRSILYNGIEERTQVELGDIRDNLLDNFRGNCGLVTGTPPYFKMNQRSRPQCDVAIPCSFEMRGGIEEYCLAAKRFLSPQGIFVVCETALPGYCERVAQAANKSGLCITKRLDVNPREGKRTLFSVYVLESRSNEENKSQEAQEEQDEKEYYNGYEILQVTIRDKNGQRTQEYVQLLQVLNMPSIDQNVRIKRE